MEIGSMPMPPAFRYRDVFLKGRPRHDVPDPFSLRHPPMPASRWAKIFAPFDALKGFEEAIRLKEAGCAAEADPAQAAELSPGGIAMCCRYYMEMSPELRPIVEEMNRSPLAAKMRDLLGKPLTSEGEVRPADLVPAVATSSGGKRAVFPMVWGYTIPGAGRPVVNCRVETAPLKPLWKEGWQQHRCAIPVSWYFEWEHLPSSSGKARAGAKYLIQPRGCALAWLAGLYRIEEFRGLKYPVFSVLTREPSEEIRFIHDRMPLILPASRVDEWISPAGDPAAVARSALTEMIFEKTAG